MCINITVLYYTVLYYNDRQYQNQVTDLQKDLQTERDKLCEYKLQSSQCKMLLDIKIEKLVQERDTVHLALASVKSELTALNQDSKEAYDKLNDEIAANNNCINQLQTDLKSKQADVFDREREITSLQVSKGFYLLSSNTL